MTPFAAGCALCGADLDPERWRSGPSTSQRAGSAFTAAWIGPKEWTVGTLLVIAILYVLGSLLSLY